jgi:hypothetical protein
MFDQPVQHGRPAHTPGMGERPQYSKRTAGRHKRLSVPHVALLVLCLGLLVLCLGISGCVPVPYRPSATVSHTVVGGDAASTIIVSSVTAAANQSMLESLARSLHEAEPRITVDTHPSFDTVFSHGPTLAQILEPTHATKMAATPADYLLTVGPMVHRQLHDAGDAEPLVPLPVVWVGYEKVQSMETLCASFADLHEPQTVDGIRVSSRYTEVIAALVYGVGTIAMPESPMRRALAEEVAHKLAAARPNGDIHLTLLAQEGGDAPGTHQCTPQPPTPKTARAHTGATDSSLVAASAPVVQP